MIVVRIELWPWGDNTHKRDLAVIAIANNGAGNAHISDYNWAISHQFGSAFGDAKASATLLADPGTMLRSADVGTTWKRGTLEGFGRKKGAVALVAAVLAKAFGRKKAAE